MTRKRPSWETGNYQEKYRLIWFQHFHKAAGTSIIKLASLNQEVLYPEHRNGNPLDAKGEEIALWDLSDNKLTDFVDHCEELGITFIANEWGAANFKLLSSDPRIILVTCLRDPLQRFLSNFYFDYWSGYNNCKTLNNYIDSDGCFTMFNYYCRILSRHGENPEPLGPEKFKVAKEMLSYFDHIMILEEDPTFLRLRQFLNWRFKKNSRYNKSSQLNRRVLKLILGGRIDLLWRRVSHPRKQPDQSFLDLFQKENCWDISLYENSQC